jgi:hypothetical protein
MSRRQRKKSRPKGVSPAPPNKTAPQVGAAVTNDVAPPPGATADGSRAINLWQVAEVAARNLVALTGLVVLGWPAPSIVALYFFDTLGALWAIFAGLMFAYFDSGKNSLGDRLYVWGSALALAGFLTAFLAIPLGIPVYVLLLNSGVTWQETAAQPGFVPAVLGIAGLALVGTIRWSLPLMDTDAAHGGRLMRAEFTLVFGRWLLALAALMAFGAFLGAVGAGLVIILYTALMIYTDLYPERFLRWFDGLGSRQGDDAG